MKLIRFMSNEEFEKYKNGQVLKNNTKHIGKTNSIGFCFFDADEFEPEDAFHYFTGIVDIDVCAIFETKKQMNKTYGEYAKHLETIYDGKNMLDWLIDLLEHGTDVPDNRVKLNEYCTTSYSNKEFKLVKYTKNVASQWNPIEIQKKFKWEMVEK